MSFSRFLVVALIAAGAAVGAVFVALTLRPAPDGPPPPVSGPADGGVAINAEASPQAPWPTPPSVSPLTGTPAEPSAAPDDASAATVLDDLNAQRTGQALPMLAFDAALAALAQTHADDMAARAYLDHVTPDGLTFKERIDDSGYAYEAAAENLGFASHLALIVPDWMRSPGHRANIVNERFSRVGIATARGTWQGVAVTYVVAVFASPR